VANYIMIASHLELADRVVRSEVIFDTLIQRNAWFLSAATPFRTEYRNGDRLLFYLGGTGNRCFVGTASVLSEPEPVTKDDVTVLKNLGLRWFDMRLPLGDVTVWPKPKPMMAVKGQLSSIKDKKNYGLYLRQGARRIWDEDFRRIADA
jgi:hypothetical protein